MPANAKPDTLEDLLERHFGHRAFRPLQREAIEAVIQGRDAFVLMPTGGGKSLCYQLPAVVDSAAPGSQPGTTLVVSPLIALMHNQVDALQTRGVQATFLNSTLDPQEAQTRERDALAGRYKLLYLAPERLFSANGRRLLAQLHVKRIAIDEAHCISEWGHDFRPEYRMLRQLRSEFEGRFRDTPILALTATATPSVAHDIVEQLELRNPAAFRGDFERRNLFYEVLPKRKPLDAVAAILKKNPGDAILYCGSRDKCERTAEQLSAAGIPTVPYHAGLHADLREANQQRFVHGNAHAVAATIAFGMGVDKPDVRYVFHLDLPQSLEAYYQETGRAGRDGQPARVILFFSRADRTRIERFIDERPDPAQREHGHAQLQSLLAFAEHPSCRMPPLLNYFGAEHPGQCEHCDNCQNPPKLHDATRDARILASAIARTGQRFGLGHIVKVLQGSKEEKVTTRGHHELSVHGLGRHQKPTYWHSLADHLHKRGVIAVGEEPYRSATLTPDAKPVLRGEVKVELPLGPLLRDTPAPPTLKRVRDEPQALPPQDAELFEALRALRLELSREHHVPPYVIFNDKTLTALALEKPATRDQALTLPGIGDIKFDRYGQQFLNAIATHTP